APTDQPRRIDGFPRKKTRGQGAAPVGVLDAVKSGAGGIADSRGKMDAADISYGARRERSLIVAEIRSGTGQGDGQFSRWHRHAKVPSGHYRRTSLLKYAEYVSP